MFPTANQIPVLSALLTGDKHKPSDREPAILSCRFLCAVLLWFQWRFPAPLWHSPFQRLNNEAAVPVAAALQSWPTADTEAQPPFATRSEPTCSSVTPWDEQAGLRPLAQTLVLEKRTIKVLRSLHRRRQGSHKHSNCKG